MSEIRLTLDELHRNQQAIKDGLGRFNVICAGRRFGKNILDKDLAISPMLEGYPVAWFEPTYKSLADIWREIRSTLQPITREKSEQEKRIEIITGGKLEMWSLEDPDSGRGRKYKRAIVNEAAFVKDLKYSWENVIRATLADMKGDALFTGTPKGYNYFFDLWRNAEDNPEWKRFRYSTYDNPFIDKAEVDSIRAEQPQRVFQQEYLAEFLEDGSYFQGIDEAAIIDNPDNPDNHKGHYIVAGLDFAMAEDYSVLTVGCRDCNRVIGWDRFNQISYTYQRERIIDYCERYNVQGLLPERNSIGQPNIEILQAAGLPIVRGIDNEYGFNTTATSKPMLIQKLASGLEHDGYKVPKDYADELRSYQVEMGVHPKFSAPSGLHDDRVISLALAWWAMTNYSGASIVAFV